jgi:hypothetical protein
MREMPAQRSADLFSRPLTVWMSQVSASTSRQWLVVVEEPGQRSGRTRDARSKSASQRATAALGSAFTRAS